MSFHIFMIFKVLIYTKDRTTYLKKKIKMYKYPAAFKFICVLLSI